MSNGYVRFRLTASGPHMKPESCVVAIAAPLVRQNEYMAVRTLAEKALDQREGDVVPSNKWMLEGRRVTRVEKMVQGEWCDVRYVVPLPVGTAIMALEAGQTIPPRLWP
jgi:4'-phosphopantetheinyl transferase EntD